MTEKTLPIILRRGLLGISFCYLAYLAIILISVCWDLRLGLCLLLLEANFCLFYSLCALSNCEGKQFFSWAARLRLLSFLASSVLIALYPNDPQRWFSWSWGIGPIWWLSHALGSVGLYIVYQEYRPASTAGLSLVLPLAAGLILYNPLALPVHLILIGAVISSLIMSFLFLWPLRPETQRHPDH